MAAKEKIKPTVKAYSPTTVAIDGEAYYTLQSFAKLLGVSETTIRKRCYGVDSIRPMRHKRIGQAWLIAEKELVEYPWIPRGKHRGKKGESIEVFRYVLHDDGSLQPQRFVHKWS